MKNNKGITLMALVVMIIVMIIIASIAVYSGLSTVRYTKYMNAKSQMETMKAEVDRLYEKYSNAENKRLFLTNYVGDGIDAQPNVKQTLADCFTDSSIAEATYRYLSTEFIDDKLGLNGISYNFLVNINTRDIVLVGGVFYEGKLCYTLKDFGIEDIQYVKMNGLSCEIAYENLVLKKSKIKADIILYNIKLLEGNNENDISKYMIYYKDKKGNWIEVNDYKIEEYTYIENEIEKTDENACRFTMNTEITDDNKYDFKIATIDGLEYSSEDIEIKVTIASLRESGEPVEENTEAEDEDGDRISIPEGVKIASDSSDDIKDGVVAEFSDGSQFVWVPVPDVILDLSSTYDTLTTDDDIKGKVQEEISKGKYPMAIAVGGTDTNGRTKYIGVLYEFTKSGDKVLITPHTNWTLKCESYTIFREPAFLSNTTDGDASTTTGRGIDLLKTILEFSGTDDEIITTWTNQMQNEFDEMVEKIYSKKGFWVGRYEMGGIVNSSTSQPGIALNAGSSSANTWYGLYKEGKNYKVNSNYKSTMIWGSQYDQMMIWMTQNGIDVTSSTVPNKGTKNTDLTKTGTETTDIINNVYDIYGGRFEWTLEACDTYVRVVRGGRYNSSDSPPATRSYYYPYHTYTYNGSRLTLY